MTRIVAVAAMVLLLCSYACAPFLEQGSPARIRDRAEELRGEAAGLRKDANECALVIERLQAQLETHQARLDGLVPRLEALDEHILTLKDRQFRLPPDEARELDVTLMRYADERAALSAQIADESTEMLALERQIASQRHLLAAYLRRAERREQAALRLDERAAELTQR